MMASSHKHQFQSFLSVVTYIRNSIPHISHNTDTEHLRQYYTKKPYSIGMNRLISPSEDQRAHR